MKNKTTQGLGNKNLLSFPKHDSLKYLLETEKQFQQSFVNTICESIRVTILIILTKQIVFPKKVHVQTTWNFRLQKISQAIIKLMPQKW
jgi:hypothetical protein